MSNSNNNNDKPWRRYTAVSPLPINKIIDRNTGAASVPGPITIAAAQDQRRRISISTLGLPSVSPSQASLYSGSRRGSAYEDIDENAIDDDEGGRSIPTTPFIRRMSLGAQAIRSTRVGSSTGIIGESTSFNYSEQFKNRAESSVSQGKRPSFSFPTRYTGPTHRRAGSITDMPAPPSIVEPSTPGRLQQSAPDEFQERMLKGHFYMD
ncbi:hypothetical protein K3495_g12912 [Podosphaera aphanis]|nr:hypothetical protein K3495_g12912 [Podosphaera aphanis]